MNDKNILEVNELAVEFHGDEGIAKAVNGVSFSVKEAQAVGIVGESGCGKSVSAFSILRLLADTARIVHGEILYREKDGTITDMTKLEQDGEEIRAIRGDQISMIFQEPMTAFSPVHTINNQISELLILHKKMTKDEAKKETIRLLKNVGIPDPERRVDDYTFQYSGGMRQRAMIAMGVACAPRILIADEPTTALDVTIQAQVLKMIQAMQRELNLSLILITHDLGVISKMVEHVYVMYLGRVVESAPVRDIFRNPKHPYTRNLLKSIPRMTGQGERLYTIKGTVPTTYLLPEGCPFHPRCEEMIDGTCNKDDPRKVAISDDHFVLCHIYNQG